MIGGGAAGFFAALSAAQHHPQARITLLEKSDKLLAKVRISGGGRCNVTHDLSEPRKLAKHYPRGEAFLRKAFAQWHRDHTVAWFKERGVALKTEADGRMFPVTDSSETIIDCLTGAAERSGIRILTRTGVNALEPGEKHWTVRTNTAELQAEQVIVASGGSPKREGLQWLADLGHTIVDPVPSLFTFNLPQEPLTTLMGTVAQARVRIEGSKLESTGPVLVTHWGLSGPAVLRLSAWGARELQARNYTFALRINWMGGRNEEELRELFRTETMAHPKRTVANMKGPGLTARLWEYLLQRSLVAGEKPLGEVGRDGLNRILATLTNDRYTAKGKTTFKEEFVTAGGVDLKEIDPSTMASLRCPGLYFAGEVLDIDGITGGFNFQAAWTTGWIAGRCGATGADARTS